MKSFTVQEQLKKLKEEMTFGLLDEGDIEKIAPFFELKNYSAGTQIFREGEAGDFIGFVVSGKIEVKKQTEFKGNQVIIALLGSGALFGEMSIFEQQRSATVETVEDSVILVLRNSGLDAITQQYPHIGIKLLKGFIRILALRLRKVTERLTTIF